MFSDILIGLKIMISKIFRPLTKTTSIVVHLLSRQVDNHFSISVKL